MLKCITFVQLIELKLFIYFVMIYWLKVIVAAILMQLFEKSHMSYFLVDF